MFLLAFRGKNLFEKNLITSKDFTFFIIFVAKRWNMNYIALVIACKTNTTRILPLVIERGVILAKYRGCDQGFTQVMVLGLALSPTL
jgi:hypothetical protein